MLGSRKPQALLVAAAAAALFAPLTLSAASASADEDKAGPQLHIDHVISKGRYVGPLQIAVYGSKIYVADAFQSTLTQVGKPGVLARGPNPRHGGDIAGVGVNTDNGDVAYASSEGETGLTKMTILRDGRVIRQVGLSRFERRNNPDKNQIYGLQDPAAHHCAADTLREHDIPVRYTGEKFSHPYAVAYLGNGAYAVADAGGNDVVMVSKYGSVTILKVLPRVPLVITQALADEEDLDNCAVGLTYYTESVPTDVELGPDAKLYVSTLPGGPESPAAGARGGVWRLGIGDYSAEQIGFGFVNATNLTITGRGAIYVAQPFIGQVSVLSSGRPSLRMNLKGVVGIEFANTHLYASTAPALVGSSEPSRVVQLAY